MADSPDARFWSEPSTGDWWVEKDRAYLKAGLNQASQQYLRYAVPKDVKTICEVGAGTGRLIRMFKTLEAHSVDVNPKLCEYISDKYPFVTVHNKDAARIDDVADNYFDLVYTYQCLQHINNNDIISVLQELLRIANDRLWLIEGFKPNKEQGEMTHPANAGSYCYYFDKVFNCEDIKLIEPGVNVYKIRKKDNPNFTIRFGEK